MAGRKSLLAGRVAAVAGLTFAVSAWAQSRTVVVDSDDGRVSWRVYDNDRFDADDFAITQFDNDRTYSAWYYDARSGQWERRGGDRYGDNWTDRDRRRVRGEVERLRTFRLFGDEMLLARIETDDGHEIRAILGPRDELRRFDIDRGDRVAVVGMPFVYQDREYLIAERIRTPRQTLLVSGNWYARFGLDNERDARFRRARDAHPQHGRYQTRTLQGEIVDTFSRRMGGELHMFADVRDWNGDILRVDLGPWDRYRGFDLETGDRIQVTGQLASIEGREALLADNVRLGYTTVTVDRFHGDHGARISGQVTTTFHRYHDGIPHLVAHIETGGGNVVRADLGPQSALRGQVIRDGEIITVDGDWMMMDGANTLIAERIMLNNRIIEVSAGHTGTFGAFPEGRFDRTDRFTGEIRSLHTESQLGSEHLIAVVRTEEGRTLTVDLGPEHRTRAYGLAEGNRITFSGAPSTFGDRNVIVAHSIDAMPTGTQFRLTTFRDGGMMRGTVMGTEVRSLDGYTNDQLLVRVRMADGSLRTVVLGDADWYGTVGISAGDQLSFRATTDISDASRLTASDVSINGRFISGGNR